MSDDHESSETSPRPWLERIFAGLFGEPRDRKELVELLRDAEQRTLLDAEALEMIEGVLQVSEMQVRDIMIPRAQMVVVHRDAPLSELLPVIVQSAHSRFPVIGETRDEVTGILLAKDLLAYWLRGDTNTFNVRDRMRPAVFIPESKRLNVLLRDFRANRNHMAIVVDEYGGVAGLVTIEDVLEQIVGEIADEHDVDDETLIKRLSDTRHVVKAITPIEEFNRHFGCGFSDDEFDTIGGLVAHGFGRLPNRGEQLDIGEFRFKVLHADKRRIHLLEASPLASQASSAETPPAAE